MKAFVVLSLVLLCVLNGGDSWKTKTVRTGYGIQFPRRPITKTAMQRYVSQRYKILNNSLLEWASYCITTLYFLESELFNKGADQTAQMRRLVCAFVVHLQSL